MSAFARKFRNGIFHASVLPHIRAVDGHSRIAIPSDGGFALIGKADGNEITGPKVLRLHGFGDDLFGAKPDFVRIVFDSARSWINLLMLALRGRDDSSGTIENDEARAGGTSVECANIFAHC